jgi:hypothetical protein
MAWTVDPPMSAEEDHGRIVSAQRQLWRFHGTGPSMTYHLGILIRTLLTRRQDHPPRSVEIYHTVIHFLERRR